MEHLAYRGQLGTSPNEEDEPTSGLGIVDFAIRVQADQVHLYSLSLPDRGIQVHALAEGQGTQTEVFQDLPRWLREYAVSGMEMIDVGDKSYLYFDSTSTGDIISYQFGDPGVLSRIAVFRPDDDFQSRITAALELTVGDQPVMIIAQQGATGLISYDVGTDLRLSMNGGPKRGAEWIDGEHFLDLTSVRIGADTFVLAAVNGLDTIKVYRVMPWNGRLEEMSSMGAANGLGIATPTALRTLTLGAETFVVVTASESSSISVLRLDQGGTLTPTDHLIDSLATRFSGAMTLETVMVEDRAYILVAGGDDGVSLFTLLPDGRLHHLDSVEDTTGISLANVGALSAVQIGDELQVFVGSQAEAGVSQFGVDLTGLGDVVRGTQENETLVGTAGDDVVAGDAGDDVVQGQAGDDILLDGTGRDTMTGGTGADVFVLVADGERDEITDFAAGSDRIDLTRFQMLRNFDQLEIEQTATGAVMTYGRETLVVTSADGGPLSGGALRAAIDLETVARMPMGSVAIESTIIGNDLAEMLEGSDARDRIEGRGGGDWLRGGAGIDTILGGDGNDSIDGGDGSDNIKGGADADTINGGFGNDTIQGGGGRDLIDMGDGADHFVDSKQYDANGADTVFGGAGNDLIMADGGDDLLYGGDGDDTIDGGTQKDRIYAGNGNDSVMGGAGSDRIYLDDGDDIFVDDALTGSHGRDTVYGGDGDDTLNGDGGSDRLSGGTGADEIRGGPGNDTLDGDDQADTIWGGDDDDVVTGGLGRDLIFLEEGHDVFHDDAQDGKQGRDTIDAGLGHDTVYGGGGNDRILGGRGDDLLYSGAGNDRIDGGQRPDTIYGGDGDDFVTGGRGNDLIYLGHGNDRFHDATQTGSDARDTVYAGLGDDTLRGRGGDDTFFGEDGEDTLLGGQGDDVLSGGAGADTLIGGSGADRFLHGRGDQADLITDFSTEEDVLVLETALWDDADLTEAQVLAQFATFTGGAVELDFGNGDVVTLQGVASIASIEAALDFN